MSFSVRGPTVSTYDDQVFNALRMNLCRVAITAIVAHAIACGTGAAVHLEPLGKITSLTTADVDGDGCDDLLSHEAGVGVVMYRSIGDGRFEPAREIFSSHHVTSFVVVEDHASGATIAVLERLGKKATRLQLVRRAEDPTSFTSTELDFPSHIVAITAWAASDGSASVLYALSPRIDTLLDQVGWTVSVKDGEIVARAPMRFALPGDGGDRDRADLLMRASASLLMGVDRAAAGDITGDDAPDVVVDGFLGSSPQAMLGSEDGDFTLVDAMRLRSFPAGGDVVLVDVNQDGRADMVTAASTIGKGVGVVLSDGQGGVESKLVAAPDYFVSNVAAADVTGDGLPDLIAGIQSADAPSIFIRNLGNGQFADARPVGFNETLGALGGPVTLGRLDANDTPDLAISINRGQRILILFSDGKGVFGAPAAQPQRNEPPF